jgi:hypothetical protein
MPLFDSVDLLIAKIRTLFIRDLALQNDYLRQENKILRSKLGKRVPINESERRVLVKYGCLTRTVSMRLSVLSGRKRCFPGTGA